MTYFKIYLLSNFNYRACGYRIGPHMSIIKDSLECLTLPYMCRSVIYHHAPKRKPFGFDNLCICISTVLKATLVDQIGQNIIVVNV